MNDIDKMPVKCRDCAYWELAREPYVCTDCESRMERLSDLSRPKTDDYIKRSDILDFLQIIPIDLGYREIEDVEKYVRDAPAADVEPVRHGRWIDAYPKKEQNPMFNYGTCSACGFEQSISNKLNFCPICGAKMDAEPPKEETVNEITPEMIEAAERNEKRIKERIDRIYDELIAEKRAEIERLKAEIAKMPPLDYDKLSENPPEYPVCVGYKCWDGKEADNGNK